jgi:multidrug efflux system outer membrane protein
MVKLHRGKPLRSRWRALRTAGALAAPLALLACSQMTPYQRPAFPAAATWPDPKLATGSKTPKPGEWRSFFTDPRLQSLIEAALEHNRDLRIALGRVDEARAMYAMARAERFPSLNLSGGESVTVTPSGVFSAGRSFNATLTSVSYEVDFWGRVASMSEAARASFLASEEAGRALRLSLIAEVADLYFNQLEVEARITYVRAALNSRRLSRDLIGRIREIGAASRLELLQAETALETTQSELAALERQQANLNNALTLLVGQMPATLPPAKPLEEQEVDNTLAVGLPSDTLLARPDVAAAEQRLIAANANIDAARAAFFPKILLTVGLGLASPALATLFNSANSAWNYQPTITLPIFDGGRTKAGEDLSVARKNIAVAEYEKSIQQAFREVSDLLAARRSLAIQRKSAEANLLASLERIKIAQIRFEAGMGGPLEILDAQRDALAAQQAALQIQRAQLGAATQLYKAIGGG